MAKLKTEIDTAARRRRDMGRDSSSRADRQIYKRQGTCSPISRIPLPHTGAAGGGEKTAV